MNSDAAVKVKKEDLLNRYSFATEIVKGILASFENGQDSMVIGINGEWGCGKSSLMEFIKSEILIQTQKDPFRNFIYQFNPWRYQNSNDLLDIFLKELGEILGNYSANYENLKSDFNRLVDVADKINSINPDPKTKLAMKGFKTLINLLKKPTSLEKLKSEADERLSDNNIKLFVFIDDLDRCTPIEITQLFQVIKLNANFKNTIFFVAYDKEIVVSALNKEFGKNGEKYLEKIVQVDYLVPKILPEQLKLLFRDNLNLFNDRFKLNITLSEIDDIWESGLRKYFSSLRQMYRLINALELRISQIIEDVYPFDFLILESIRIFDYSAYEWIYKYREDLIFREIALMPSMVESVKVNGSQKDFVQNHSELKDTSPETKSLILILFDVDDSNKTDGFFINKSKGRNSDIELNRRVASQKYFDHYFSFEVSPQNLPLKEVKNFIALGPEKKKEQLTKYFGNGRFERFLDQLSDVLMNESFDHKSETIEAFLNQSDENQYEIKNVGNFRLNALTLLVRVITRVGKTLVNADEKRTILNLFLTNKQGSYSRFFLIDTLYQRLTKGRVYPETEFIDESIITEYKDNIISRLKDHLWFFGNETFKDPRKYDIGIINYFLKRYHEFYPKEYNDGIIKLSSDPNYTVLLFRSSLTVATRSGYDKPGYNLKGTHFLPEFTSEKFDEMMTKTSFDELDDENKKFYNLFLKLKENKFNKDQFFTIDLDHWEF